MARLRPWILAVALVVTVVAYMIANPQQTQQANAVELTVLSAGAMRAALAERAPLFERSSGPKLIIEYGMVGKVEEKVVGDRPPR
jgi:ABC-type molybdate transport system substrate-binding protein